MTTSQKLQSHACALSVFPAHTSNAFVQALIVPNGKKDSERPWVAVPASPGSKQFSLHYPNTGIENGQLDFPQGTCLVLGPHCQGILFKSCTLSGMQ
jgi:hypothetical protein